MSIFILPHNRAILLLHLYSFTISFEPPLHLSGCSIEANMISLNYRLLSNLHQALDMSVWHRNKPIVPFHIMLRRIARGCNLKSSEQVCDCQVQRSICKAIYRQCYI